MTLVLISEREQPNTVLFLRIKGGVEKCHARLDKFTSTSTKTLVVGR